MRWSVRLGVACVVGAIAPLAVAGCSGGSCGETLTCDGPDGASRDGTVDSAPEATADATPEAADGAPTDAGDAAMPDAGGCAAQGQVCIPPVPAHFSGPVAFVELSDDGGVAPSPPSCQPPYAVDVVDGFEAPVFAPASCACTCGAMDGGCTTPTVETYTDNVCVNSCDAVLVTTCTSATCALGSQSASVVTPTQPSGGACAEAVQSTVPPWDPTQDWATAGRGCGAGAAVTDAGCGGSGTCAPAPPSGADICVWQAGDVLCPSTYPGRHVVYASATDSRSCLDQCSCASPSGVSCAATVTVSTSPSCTGGTLVLGSCTSYDTTATPYVSATVTASGGSCASSGTATPNGTVVPTMPTTVCCAD